MSHDKDQIVKGNPYNDILQPVAHLSLLATIWFWPIVWGFLGLVTRNGIIYLGFSELTFSICWTTLLVVPVICASIFSQWFLRRIVFFAIAWTLSVGLVLSLTVGALEWFYVHTYYQLTDPRKLANHLGY